MGSMFNNFSRFVDSGRRRPGSRDRRRYEPDRGYDRRDRYYEPEYDMGRSSYDRDMPTRGYDPQDRAYEQERMYEQERIFEQNQKLEQDRMYEQNQKLEKEKEANAATIREMGRERTDLQAQVAELKQQVELLNSLMEAKDNQLKEFEEAMENNNSEQINNLIVQINDRFSKLESKLDVDSGRNDQMVNVISENVHNESVKCYRNIQVILEEIQKKLDVVENKKVSLLGTTACVVITMLLSLGNLALLVLRILGIV